MFAGESSHTLDKKHRVFIPKRFQEILERDENGNYRVVLTRGFDGCLFLFSEQGFEDVKARLLTQAFGGSELRTMQRLFFANVNPLQLDASGRLILPEKLRKLAGIETEVVLIGVADRAEIWDRAVWEKFEADNEASFDELDVVLVGRGRAQGEGSPGGGGDNGQPDQ